MSENRMCVECLNICPGSAIACPECGTALPNKKIQSGLLRKCLACENEVSQEAKVCPQCGHPVRKEKKKRSNFTGKPRGAMLVLRVTCILLLGIECLGGLFQAVASVVRIFEMNYITADDVRWVILRAIIAVALLLVNYSVFRLLYGNIRHGKQYSTGIWVYISVVCLIPLGVLIYFLYLLIMFLYNR